MLLLTADSWQLCGLLCLEATKLLISPKLWLCSNKDRQTSAWMYKIQIHYIHNVAPNTTAVVILPSFIITFDHTLAFRAWIILFIPVDSGKSSKNGKRETSQSPYPSMKLRLSIFFCLLNSPSSSGSSCGLSSTSSKAWPKHHCCASCLVTPRIWNKIQTPYKQPYATNFCLNPDSQRTVFTDPFTHQNEHFCGKLFHYGYPRIQLLQTILL